MIIISVLVILNVVDSIGAIYFYLRRSERMTFFGKILCWVYEPRSQMQLLLRGRCVAHKENNEGGDDDKHSRNVSWRRRRGKASPIHQLDGCFLGGERGSGARSLFYRWHRRHNR